MRKLCPSPKHAQIVPIPKAQADFKHPVNYRPISLLPTIGKLFERLLEKHIRAHLSSHNIIQEEQFGFMPRHSTTNQLLRIIEFAKEGFGKGEKTAILFLDIEKAFDKLWLQGLIAKCISADMPPWMISIIHSFLTPHTFQVKINQALSTIKQTTAGVPKGSVLGPLLFNLYMADLKLQDPVQLALYADDAAVYARAHQYISAQLRLQEVAPQLERWYKTWRMKINVSKTKAILLDPKNKQVVLPKITLN